VKSRLVLENNDTGNTWTVNNLKRYFYNKYNIPITFDNLHHEMLNHDISPPLCMWIDHAPEAS
jgi:UV DNA damage repair endonuclease